MATLTTDLKQAADDYSRNIAKDLRTKCAEGGKTAPRILRVLCANGQPLHQSITINAGRDADGSFWADVDGERWTIASGAPLKATIQTAILRRMIQMDATTTDLEHDPDEGRLNEHQLRLMSCGSYTFGRNGELVPTGR